MDDDSGKYYEGWYDTFDDSCKKDTGKMGLA